MATEPPLGTKIRRARERKRMSQQQLANALDVSRGKVNAWENGRARPASSIGALEEVLGISLDTDDADDTGTAAENAEKLKEIAELRRRLETLASEIKSDDDGNGESRPRAG